MSITFTAENHKYQSTDPNEKIDWLSVTSFVGKFKQKFDPIAQSIKSSKNKKSKWYGIDPEVIRQKWDDETNRAINAGSKYHDQREKDLIEIGTIQRSGVNIPIFPPIYNGAIKESPSQKLVEGIYPEHMVYLKSAGLCGQADRIEVVQNLVNVYDYKTNKEIKKAGYKKWDGSVEKMLDPIGHLDDCNFNHYSLQLSTYMYIILKHNPIYKPGKMCLQHVIFEIEKEDKFGYPIYKLDKENNYIVKEVVVHEVPYLKSEVISMINHIKDGK